MRRAVLAALIRPSSLRLLLSLPPPAQTLSLRLFSSSLPSPQCQPPPPSESVASVLQRWGCSDADVSTILGRFPLVGKMDVDCLQSRLEFLRDIGFRGPDLVRFVTCAPRFLRRGTDTYVGLGLRVEFLNELFGSRQLAFQIILRNPSLLIYDVDRMRRSVELYDGMGVSRKDLAVLLRCRPMVLTRSNLDQEEKVEFIKRTGIPRESKMYKYIVSVVAVSRLETIYEKVTNLERFGFSDDEVWQLIGRSPNILTFSVDKVQRHMTFIMGTMSLPANSVVQCPSLLETNLDKVVKPRFLVMCKLREMGLSSNGKNPSFMAQAAVRMREPRFLNVFITCHENCIARELMEFYNKMKEVRRLAEASRLSSYKGFPF